MRRGVGRHPERVVENGRAHGGPGDTECGCRAAEVRAQAAVQDGGAREGLQECADCQRVEVRLVESGRRISPPPRLPVVGACRVGERGACNHRRPEERHTDGIGVDEPAVRQRQPMAAHRGRSVRVLVLQVEIMVEDGGRERRVITDAVAQHRRPPQVAPDENDRECRQHQDRGPRQVWVSLPSTHRHPGYYGLRRRRAIPSGVVGDLNSQAPYCGVVRKVTE